MRYELFVALRYMRARRKQGFVSVITLISIMGVAVGVAALIIAQAMMTGFFEEIQAKILSGNPDLLVWNAEPGSVLQDPAALASSLGALPGVRAVAPVILGNGMAVGAAGREPTGVEIFGVDPVREAAVTSVAAHMVEGRLDQLTPGGNGLILGAELAESLGVEVGGVVRLVIPQVRVSPLTPPMARNRLFEITGIFNLDFYQWDAGRVYMHIDDAREFLSRGSGDQVSALEVRATSLDLLPVLRTEITRLAPAEIFVGDVMERNSDFFRALRTEKIWMFLAIGLIILVASMNIVSTLILMVMDKVRAIGALVALGAQVRGILAVFMLQGIIIGVVGTALGALLGTSACWLLDSRQLIQLSPEVYFISHVPFHTGVRDVALAAGLALGVSFVATIYPSVKAARLDPVEALRHE